MPSEGEFDTTVLPTDYSDFQDTVVEQAADPAPFWLRGESGKAAKQEQRPTWIPESTQTSSGSQPASQQPASDPKPPSAQAASLQPAVSQPANAQVVSARPPSEQPPNNQRPAEESGNAGPYRMSPVLIGVLVGLAAVAVIAIAAVAVMLLMLQGKTDDVSEGGSANVVVPTGLASSSSSVADSTMEKESAQESKPEEQSKSSSGSGTAGSGAVIDEHRRATSEAEFYRKLSEYYDLAGDYDSSIRDAANDFNNTYLKEDRSPREANAKSAAALKSKIKSSWDSLKKLDPPMKSVNTQAYLDMCELYECLWHRIDVIDQAWKIDLQYDKPEEHEADIVAPLQSQQVNGVDTYYDRFKDLYPRVSLVKP